MFQPGCPCCECPVASCGLHEDDFSSDTIDDYTEISGNWTISSGIASTPDANAVLLWATDAGDQHSVSAILVPPSDIIKQDVFRIIVGWEDSSNYLYARVRCNGFGGYLLSLREVISGTDSEIKSEIAISKNADNSELIVVAPTRILLSLCYEKTAKRLSYVGASLDSGSAADGMMITVSGEATISNTSGLGNYCGIGTGAVASTSVAFTKFWAYSAGENCIHCFCNVCDVGTSPASITVEFSGVVDGDCSDCDMFNTTSFVLDRRSNSCAYTFAQLWNTVDCGDGMATPSESYWESIEAFFFCSDYATNEGGLFIIRVRYQDYSTKSFVLKYAEFRLSFECCKVDCMALLTNENGVDVPFYGIFRSGPSADSIMACDWTNATATVTAVA